MVISKNKIGKKIAAKKVTKKIAAKKVTKKIAAKNVTKYVVKKGSIAIDGISLTVVDIKKTLVSVSLIPHTKLFLLNIQKTKELLEKFIKILFSIGKMKVRLWVSTFVIMIWW